MRGRLSRRLWSELSVAEALAGARADERVSTELKQNIMKARLEKKWTQAQLAQVRS